jgi:1,2-diacylglycerol 3-alpha-glucosyltransferase
LDVICDTMNYQKKHVVWLTPGFAAHADDTSCIPPLQDLALLLKAANIKLTIVTMHYPFEFKKYEWNGIQVFSIGGKNKRQLFKARTYFKTWNTLKQIHKAQPIDALHSFWIGDSSLIAQQFSKRKNIKHIATIMGQDAGGNKYFRWSNFYQMQLASLSDQAAILYKSKTGINSTVIPFGICKTMVTTEQSRTIDLLAVGSIIALKNHLAFLELVLQLKTNFPSLTCMIIGQHHDKAELLKITQFIATHHLEKNVTVLDVIPRENVLKYMATSKILVHLSLYESQGMVMLEALAQGCKVFSGGQGINIEHPQFTLLPKEMNKHVSLLTEELKSNRSYPSYIPFSMEATCKAYVNLYNF